MRDRRFRRWVPAVFVTLAACVVDDPVGARATDDAGVAPVAAPEAQRPDDEESTSAEISLDLERESEQDAFLRAMRARDR